jgi:hypothetical protein
MMMEQKAKRPTLEYSSLELVRSTVQYVRLTYDIKSFWSSHAPIFGNAALPAHALSEDGRAISFNFHDLVEDLSGEGTTMGN